MKKKILVKPKPIVNKNNCKMCERLKEENAYLRTLVDNIFISKGIGPAVDPVETVIPETEQEKIDRALVEKGAERYGE